MTDLHKPVRPSDINWANLGWKEYVNLRESEGFENGVSVFLTKLCAPFKHKSNSELTLDEYCARYMVARYAEKLCNTRAYPYELALEDWEEFTKNDRPTQTRTP